MKTVLARLVTTFISSVLVCIGANAVSIVYTVTNTYDAGAGSLRQAIIDANANPGADIIRFNIAVGGGNVFEGTAPYTYAVIQINTVLPTITEALVIDGTTQSNTNNNSTVVTTVGVDGITIGAIPYPDLYLVPSASFVFPINSTGVTGNGLSIDAPNVTVKGLAISGFGNTHTNGGTASGHADIEVLRSPLSRIVNITITNCFLSCDPTGAFPAQAQRRTKGNGILVAGNNDVGFITNNYIAHSGTYGIHFNGNVDNNNVGPASTTVGSANWVVSGNQLYDISTNTTISALSRVSDAITLMKCTGFNVINNYIQDAEQMGVDIGYNSDFNIVSNNTVTGFIKTSAFQLQAGLRIGLSSEGNTLLKNVIYNNTATTFKGGVWIDRSSLVQAGVVVKDNMNNIIQENRICSNAGSGVVMSTTGGVNCFGNLITKNSIYDNVGLGIDLNYNGTTGPVQVTVNDDGDGDAGTNNLQNFPIIDSVRRMPGNIIAFYGKAPAGSTIEFFISDGQLNNHGGRSLNYGEGKTYLGTAVEGLASDGRSGFDSYNNDGNIASANASLFFITLHYTGTITSLDSVTATATIANNTSEFGPVVKIMSALPVNLLSFSSSYNGKNVNLNWEAASDRNFLYFDIEHSTDGRNFSKHGTVTTKGFDRITDYDFTDADFAAGKNYYRLKMVNTGGKISYSHVLSVNIRQKDNEAMMTNSSFSDHIQLQVQSEKEEEIAVHLFNGAGKLVAYTEVRGKQGTNYIQLNDLGKFSSGMYILQVKTGSSNLTQKLIKR